MKSNIKAVFEDGTFIQGRRGLSQWWRESRRTHHIKVTLATDKSLENLEVAIPIDKPKYWIVF